MEIEDIKVKIKMLADQLDQLENSHKENDKNINKKLSNSDLSGIIGHNKSNLDFENQS